MKLLTLIANLFPRKLTHQEIAERELSRLEIERMFAMDNLDYARNEFVKAEAELSAVDAAINLRQRSMRGAGK